MDRKNEALNYLKQYPKMDEYLHGCGSNKHKVSGADEREMLYKEMKLKDKLPDMSEDEQLQLLATNGMLVKRPLVVAEGFVLTGFKEKEWTEKML